uniref:Mas-related G protein-coupled receptor G2 n=2 Tax=Otolemur garnettii TaxID=30611 RepID=W8W3F4_OTOGA|nr:TPA: Mas-related G protein-coupled receptor G2 [Otolemur garnettii]
MDPDTPKWSTEPTSRNGSLETSYLLCELQHRITIWVLLIIAVVGLAGNAVVLWLLGFRMRRNAFSVYILNLAVADFLYLCCCIVSALTMKPFYLSYDVSLILVPVGTFSYFTGLSMLSAISTERCLSALWPIWYRCHRPRHMSAVVCALLWALSLLLSTLDFFICYFWIEFIELYLCPILEFIISTCLMVLFVILCGSSLALLTRFLCGSRGTRMTRLYLTMLLTVLVFLVCGLPWGVYWFLLFWINVDIDFPCYFVEVSIMLSCVNSSANPLIYFFIGYFRQQRQGRRQTLKMILERALQDTPEGKDCGDSLPQETLELSESRWVQ